MQVSSVFQYINDESEVLEVARPQCEPLDSLISVINKHYGIKDSVVDSFVQFHVSHLMWAKWDAYKNALVMYEEAKTAIEEHNAEAVQNPEMEIVALPDKPTWSDDDVAYITTDYVLGLPEVLEAKKNATKNKGVDIGGIKASLTKSDQNGLGDLGVVVLFKELVDKGVLTADADVQAMLDALPENLTFHFQNGVQAPIGLNMNGFCRFTLPFLNHRQTVL